MQQISDERVAQAEKEALAVLRIIQAIKKIKNPRMRTAVLLSAAMQVEAMQHD